MKPSQHAKRTSSKSFKASVAIVAAALIVLAVSYILLRGAPQNYAEMAAKPIEDALQKGGAKKTSSVGDPGHGPDNDEPWYDASFETSLGRDEATKLIEQAASQSGYSLNHASPTNRGPLGAVADKYIENWFYDNISKSADYSGLSSGNVQLAMAVNYQHEQNMPEPKPTTIRVLVRLPTFR